MEVESGSDKRIESKLIASKTHIIQIKQDMRKEAIITKERKKRRIVEYEVVYENGKKVFRRPKKLNHEKKKIVQK